jgi:hypothetical protein
MEDGNGTEISEAAGGNNSSDSSVSSVDPRAISAAAAAARSDDASSGGGGPKKRHRRTKAELERDGYQPKAASGSSSTSKKAPLTVDGLAFSLSGIHSLLAVTLSAPELAWKDDEAKIVAENMVAVSRHYDIQASQKAIDWGNLVIALGTVYGRKVVPLAMRKSREATAARKARMANAGFTASPMSPAANPAKPNPVSGTRSMHPNAAGPPTGAGPVLRPKQPSDLALLDEPEEPLWG